MVQIKKSSNLVVRWNHQNHFWISHMWHDPECIIRHLSAHELVAANHNRFSDVVSSSGVGVFACSSYQH